MKKHKKYGIFSVMIEQFLSNYLKMLSVSIIRKNVPKVIGITGSVAKTSTKEAIFEVLKSKFNDKIYKSYGNLNTEIGLPLAILKFDYSPKKYQWLWALPIATFKYLYFIFNKNYPEILVLEYGADKPGDIEKLTKIVRADVAVITEIGASHLQCFKSIDKVAKEKIKLAKNLNPDGIAVLNEDNKYIKEEAKKVFFEKIWYHGSTVNGAKNAAIKIGKLFNISENKSKEILDKIENIPGRLNLIKGINDSLIIDDTYNSNPLSVKNALEKLRLIFKNKKFKRKIIVLADMLELGKNEKKLHKEVALQAIRTANLFITVGDRFEEINSDKWFESPSDAGIYLSENIKKGDLILIKGSQGMRMEKTVEKILYDKHDSGKLVRQSKYWKNKKYIKP